MPSKKSDEQFDHPKLGGSVRPASRRPHGPARIHPRRRAARRPRPRRPMRWPAFRAPPSPRGTLPFPADDPKAKSGGILKIAMEVQKMEDPATYSWVQMSQSDAPHARISVDDRTRQHHAPDARRELEADRGSQDLDLQPAQGRDVAQWRGVHRRSRRLEHHALARPEDGLVQCRPLLRERHGRGQRREGRQGQADQEDDQGRARGRRQIHAAPELEQSRAVGAGGFLQLPDRDRASLLQGAALRQHDRHRPLRAGRVQGRRQMHPEAREEDQRTARISNIGAARSISTRSTTTISTPTISSAPSPPAMSTRSMQFSVEQIDMAKSLPGAIHVARTAQTICCRMQVDQKPFTDKRVRQAIVKAVDNAAVKKLVYARGRRCRREPPCRAGPSRLRAAAAAEARRRGAKAASEGSRLREWSRGDASMSATPTAPGIRRPARPCATR